MNRALEKHGLKLRVHALVSIFTCLHYSINIVYKRHFRVDSDSRIEQVDDIVGNLAGGRYYEKDCVAAITLGMGTNAAYVDTTQSAPRWHDSLPKKGEIVSDFPTPLYLLCFFAWFFQHNVCGLFHRLFAWNGETSIHAIFQ